jgi:putative transposase
MPRFPRHAPGGLVYHVLNRRVDRNILFTNDDDYAAFESIIGDVLQLCSMRVCAYCLMPNHWHMVLWPERDNDLPRFMHRLTVTHAVKWKKYKEMVGTGHLYQNRYKSFPVDARAGFLPTVRYVERNAQRAGLVARAEDWQWSSLWQRLHTTSDEKSLLSTWPVEYPPDWMDYVNAPTAEEEERTLRECVRTGRPYGPNHWMLGAVGALDLQTTLRQRGRPKKGDRSLIKGLL